MRDFPLIKALGEKAILIEFPPQISWDMLERILLFKKILETHYFECKVEVISTYSSLLISYHYSIEDIYGEVLVIKGLLGEAKINKKTKNYLYHIPVCYEGDFAPDMEELALVKNLEKEEVIRLHTSPCYTVFFIGFLPGFLYLGGLDPKLYFSRKKIPRLQVQKGAVGIGEKQTGIYPKNSPGGWQIIGNSPVPLFNINDDPPSQFSAGDRIKFFPVPVEEYYGILREVKSGNFRYKKEKYER